MANGNFGGGKGTKEEPYLVEDVADFLSIKKLSGYFAQVNDIDFGYQMHTPFEARSIIYDGLGNSVKNLADCLFYGLNGSTVKNLACLNSNITQPSPVDVGILASGTSGATITNCYTTGFAHGKRYVGGIIGISTSNSGDGCVISNCYSTATLSSDGISGGVAGGIAGWIRRTTIRNCFFFGGQFYYSGDSNVVYGFIYGTSTSDYKYSIENCYYYDGMKINRVVS